LDSEDALLVGEEWYCSRECAERTSQLPPYYGVAPVWEPGDDGL
jgi:hypothetical protein